jgi:hypothetical protein
MNGVTIIKTAAESELSIRLHRSFFFQWGGDFSRITATKFA